MAKYLPLTEHEFKSSPLHTTQSGAVLAAACERQSLVNLVPGQSGALLAAVSCCMWETESGQPDARPGKTNNC